jgi:hypothetical protein
MSFNARVMRQKLALPIAAQNNCPLLEESHESHLGFRTAMREPTDGLEALATACRHGASPATCLETLARYFPRMRRKADRLASRRRYAPPSAGVHHFHELTCCHLSHQRPRIHRGRKTRTRGSGDPPSDRRVPRLTFLPDSALSLAKLCARRTHPYKASSSFLNSSA